VEKTAIHPINEGKEFMILFSPKLDDQTYNNLSSELKKRRFYPDRKERYVKYDNISRPIVDIRDAPEKTGFSFLVLYEDKKFERDGDGFYPEFSMPKNYIYLNDNIMCRIYRGHYAEAERLIKKYSNSPIYWGKVHYYLCSYNQLEMLKRIFEGSAGQFLLKEDIEESLKCDRPEIVKYLKNRYGM